MGSFVIMENTYKKMPEEILAKLAKCRKLSGAASCVFWAIYQRCVWGDRRDHRRLNIHWKHLSLEMLSELTEIKRLPTISEALKTLKDFGFIERKKGYLIKYRPSAWLFTPKGIVIYPQREIHLRSSENLFTLKGKSYIIDKLKNSMRIHAEITADDSSQKDQVDDIEEKLKDVVFDETLLFCHEYELARIEEILSDIDPFFKEGWRREYTSVATHTAFLWDDKKIEPWELDILYDTDELPEEDIPTAEEMSEDIYDYTKNDLLPKAIKSYGEPQRVELIMGFPIYKS